MVEGRNVFLQVFTEEKNFGPVRYCPADCGRCIRPTSASKQLGFTNAMYVVLDLYR